MKTLVEMRRERIRAGKDDWEFDYIDTSEIMNSRIEEFDSRFTEPEEEIEQELLDYIGSCGCNPDELDLEFMDTNCRECMQGTLKPAFEEESEEYEW